MTGRAADGMKSTVGMDVVKIDVLVAGLAPATKARDATRAVRMVRSCMLFGVGFGSGLVFDFVWAGLCLCVAPGILKNDSCGERDDKNAETGS
jgi:hypothetical protein